MRKHMKNLLAVLVILSMTISFFSFSYDVQAAKNPKLNKKNIVLRVGKSYRLKVRNTKKKVKWTTSKKRVATVSKKGVVKARLKGTAKITAKVGKKKLICQVTVKNKASKTTTSSSYQKKVLQLVNKERAKKGKEALVLDPALCRVAMLRAKELITKFSHTRPDGTNCFTAVKEAGISYMTAGENIAAGQRTPKDVMFGWMNSTGHRENILSSDFGKIGVGYVKSQSGYGHYWVQIFTN